jgi:hypothetical protein
LQETWNIQCPDLVNIDGFQQIVFETRTDTRGGGVGMYIRNGLEYQIRKDLQLNTMKTFENITIEVKYSKKAIIFSNIYRSPTTPPGVTQGEYLDDFLCKLDEHLNRVTDTNRDAYVFLDSNIDLLKSQHLVSSEYLDTIICNGFLQIISKATRIQGNSISLIDHILVNNNLQNYNAGTIVTDISDHMMNFIEINVKTQVQSNKAIKKRLFSTENINNFKQALAHTDWTNVLTNNDANDSFDKFWELFSINYQNNFPLRRLQFNKNKHKINPYMTNGLLISRTKKNELYKIYINSKSNNDKVQYTNYRNLYNTLIKTSKKLYYEDSLQKIKKDSKKTWDILKDAAGLKKRNNDIGNLTVNGEDISNPKILSNEFNTFFTKIGVEISNSVKPTLKKDEEYINNLNAPPLDLGTVNQPHICDIIKSLKSKGSLDIDGISTNLLKAIKIEISTPLAHIFKLSLETGIFPSKLKISRTVPIFKAGDPKLCDNYRPIALLSAMSKILEKVVSIQLVNHLDRNNLIYEHQYGFQRSKSTEHSLVHAVNFIGNAMNENKYALGVFFDLKKAFDVCSHEILLMKLERMGVRDTALLWFRHYLSNRKQIVDINGHRSDEKGIEISILQGSILGPILFLIYINDLHSVTSLLSLMFADDTFCLKSGPVLNTLITDVNN